MLMPKLALHALPFPAGACWPGGLVQGVLVRVKQQKQYLLRVVRGTVVHSGTLYLVLWDVDCLVRPHDISATNPFTTQVPSKGLGQQELDELLFTHGPREASLDGEAVHLRQVSEVCLYNFSMSMLHSVQALLFIAAPVQYATGWVLLGSMPWQETCCATQVKWGI
jgi:hypothetical protein